jgi:hypothetical protein
MSEFLDIVHYAFELDSEPKEEEYARAHTRIRSVIYGMYGVELYTWGASPGPSLSPDSFSDDQDLPAMPKMTHQPYVPPTPMTHDPNNPFEGLDAPLG